MVVAIMCSGRWDLGAFVTSIKGGNTDVERSPPPGLCERENISMKAPYLARKYHFEYNIIEARFFYKIK